MHPYQQTTVAVIRPQSSTVHIVIAWVVAALTGLYMLPWAIAATRSKQSVALIAVFNFFLGWTAVGWVIALVWACFSDRPTTVVASVTTSPYGYPLPGYGYPYPPPPGPGQPYPQIGYAQPAPQPYVQPYQQQPPVTQPLPTGSSAPPAYGSPTDDETRELPRQS